MKVALSVIGTFHTFDLARELHARHALAAIFTGYPRFKLKNEKLPPELVHSFPWVHTPYMAFPRRDRLGTRLNWAWEYLDKVTLDAHVSRRLPECDVFVGLSGSALQSGKAAQRRGAAYVCDRGSTHIRVQDTLQREEHVLWGETFKGVDPRVIALEEAEYAEADCITVPSSFNIRSFVSQGIPAEKIRRLPYGVNLERFHPTQAPDPTRFDILFAGGMSLRKGVPYLLQAYKAFKHPRKSLTFAGAADANLIEKMRQLGLWPDDAKVLGHLPQPQLKDLMSRSHAMVLPSIEEGLALVQAQAMACGCPVIGTEHTGSEDLFTNGQEGFIVPIRRADLITERLTQLADQPELRARMSQAALLRVKQTGGWHAYGDSAMAIYQELLA
jgi:starch synthase